jgi:hypothetical protein
MLIGLRWRLEKMSVSVEAMRQHVAALCDEHDITISWCRRPTEAWAVIDFEEICIPSIKSPISYATARHEIGRILGRYQRSKHEMVRERWAWRWAKRDALMWTPLMGRRADASLQHHAAGNVA